MKDRVLKDIGATGQLTDWSQINWRSANKRVRNLRRRIFRATQCGQWNKVRSLMKLMLRSFSNLLLAVRKVTQVNQGKKTAGIDGQKVLTPKERVKFVHEIMGKTSVNADPTRRVYIPKANGKRRPLGIPTVKDRTAQAVVKNALEPSWEARFEANSYGFRLGRSTQDAIDQVFLRLNGSREDTYVLDADIKGAFDNISHEYLTKAIGDIPGKDLITEWLKAGYVEMGKIYPTDSGTPQGGIISPLLANIALDGLEEYLSQFKKKVPYWSNERNKTRYHTRPRYGFVRYADDFIITAPTKEDLISIKPIIEHWLALRGLQLNQEKTKIVHIDDGFDFLGFNVRHYKGTLLIKPQVEKLRTKLQEIRDWLKAHPGTTQEEVIKYLNPIIRGWGNYYRYVVSKEAFSYFYWMVNQALKRWAFRRHPNKSKRWVISKYFPTDGFTFSTRTLDRRGNPFTISLVRLSKIEIERHIKVKGTSSPDDPKLVKYWKDRATRDGKSYWAKDSKKLRIAQNQDWRCPTCGEYLFNGEATEVHHKVPVKEGGTDELKNLVHIHKSCHKNVHGGRKSKDRNGTKA